MTISHVTTEHNITNDIHEDQWQAWS